MCKAILGKRSNNAQYLLRLFFELSDVLEINTSRLEREGAGVDASLL
jgi:hypothetical protein